MNFQHSTLQYYSRWLGSENILLDKTPGISFIRSEERDKIQAGHSNPFAIYAWMEKDRLIVSYGEKAAPNISLLQNTIADCFSVDAVSQAISEIYGREPSHHIKFVFHEAAMQNGMARPLVTADYKAYLAFFKQANPGCSDTGWVRDYFEEMVASHLCCGVFVGDCLVSCTDAPLMPYMKEEVQEIGINTLSAFMRKGYAAQAAMVCAGQIVQNGKCPQWSCATDNIASSRLAEKAGFARLSDVLTLTL